MRSLRSGTLTAPSPTTGGDSRERPSQEPVLLDRTGASLAPCTPAHLKPAADWPPVIVTRETIEREVERLADLPPPDKRRPQTPITHPDPPPPRRGATP